MWNEADMNKGNKFGFFLFWFEGGGIYFTISEEIEVTLLNW